MTDIDTIMDMLDWNNPIEIQDEGRRLARKIRCINVFLQPGHLGHCKNVWGNCAMILAERTDEELSPYLFQLFNWLVDMNWPGAECILARLKKYKADKLFDFALDDCIKIAELLGEEIWLDVLKEIKGVRRR